MLPAFKNTFVATVAALSIALTAPAHAGDKGTRKFVAGLATGALVGVLINEANQNQRRNQPNYTYVDPPYQPYYQPRYYNEYQPSYQPSYQPHYEYRPEYRPRAASVRSTAAASAYQSYSRSERRQIQKRLAAFGYYNGSIDGAFGPGTFRAVQAYARDEGLSDELASRNGAYSVFDSLIY